LPESAKSTQARLRCLELAAVHKAVQDTA